MVETGGPPVTYPVQALDQEYRDLLSMPGESLVPKN
jgi:hypothetical protein